MPLVSIIMPAYNERKYMIQAAIDSVMNQTFIDWELIIICDNSYDDSLKCFLLNIQDERIKIFFNKQNIGAALSRNEGIKNSKGKYIAFLDADDVCKPDRIEIEVDYLEAKSYDMVCSGRHIIDEEGNMIRKFEQGITEESLIDSLPYINYIYNSSVLIKKSILDAMGGYRDYPCCHDYELWMRIRKAGYKIGYIDRDLVGYRIRKKSITSDKSYLQAVNCAFFRKQYKQDKILNDYNKQEYEKFVGKFLINPSRAINHFNTSVERRKKFTEKFEQKKYFAAIYEYVRAVLGSRIYRLNIYNSLNYKFFVKIKCYI